MVLGKLGEQIVLISQKAFASIEFVNAIPAPNEIYLPKKLARDTAARKDFQQERKGLYSHRKIYSRHYEGRMEKR